MNTDRRPIPFRMLHLDTGRGRLRSVRTLLVWLVLACLLPGLIGAAFFLSYEYRQGREDLERDTLQTARALVQAVDIEVLSVQRLAQGLATADAIADGDLAQFHQQAQRALLQTGVGSTVALTDRTGQFVLNTALALGMPLPRNGNPDLIRRVFETGRPVVSDLFTSAITGTFLMAVGVPVVLDGQTSLALTVAIGPERFNDILRAQQLPEGWVATVFDASGTIVARSRAADEFVGLKPAPGYFDALMKPDTDVFEAVMSDGVPVLAAMAQSPVTQWRVAVNIPQAALATPLGRNVAGLALGILVLFTIGLGVAWAMSGRIARSFQALVRPAVSLGAGGPVVLPEVDVKEAAEVTHAMDEAASLLRARTAALEARERELAQRSQALRQSEIRLQTLTEHAPAAIAVFDRDMRYLAVSRRWLADYRVSAEDIVGKGHYELYPDIPDKWREAHRRGLAGEVLRGEADRFERADGSVQWTRWEVWPWRDDSGAVGGIVIAAENITERVQAEERLRASEEQYRLLFTNMNEALVIGEPILDDEGRPTNLRMLRVNEAFYRLTMLPRGIEGRTLREFMPRLGDVWVERYAAVATTGRPDSFDHFNEDTQRHYQVYAFSPSPGRFASLFLDVTQQKRMEEQLRESEERFRLLADNIPQLAWMADEAGRIFWYNERWLKYTGTTLESMQGWGWQRVHHPEHVDRIMEGLQRCMQTGEAWEDIFPIRRADGEYRWFLSRAVPQRDDSGRVLRWFGTNTDVTEHKEAEEALRNSEERFRTMAEALPEIVFVTDAEGRTSYINSRWSEQVDLPREEAIGSGWLAAIHPEDREASAAAWQEAVAQGSEFKREQRFRAAGEGYRWYQVRAIPIRDDAGRIVQWFGACSDIHDVKVSQSQLQHAALHDPLTSLPNRALFQARLEEALLRAQRHRAGAAVMFIDLDHFKPINDSLGHAAGDLALQAIARRLQQLVRKTDTVARLGGDEFAILLEDLHETEEAARVARAVLDAVSEPIALAGREVTMSASVGISCHPQDGDDPGRLLRNADAAMYRAKHESRAAYRFFAPEMNAQAEQKFFMANSLRRVVERDELVLHYQPRVDMTTGRTLGVEALVRWQSPEHGLIEPGRFIRIAEEIGAIEPIGEWVLRRACEQYVSWQQQGMAPEFMSVNLSPRQFGREHICGRIEKILSDTGMPAAALELELTESVVMQDPEKSSRTLEKLDDLGIRLALDDFGTGCSGLAYLKRFPISHLKIDQSFVQDAPDDPEDAAIIRAIIALADSLKLSLTAEGVETEAQRAFLVAEGCHTAQGFLFSTPMPADQLGAALRH